MTDRTAPCAEPKTGELLAAYEMNLLAPASRRRFEEHLERCADCAGELYALSGYVTTMLAAPGAVARRIEATAAPTAEATVEQPPAVLDWLAPVRQRLSSLAQPGAWPRLLAPIGTAAALAAVLLIVLEPGSPSDTELARLEPVPYVPIGTRAAGATPAGRSFEAGMAAYAARRYDDATLHLRRCLEAAATAGGLTAATRSQAHLFLGISLLLTGKTEGSRPALETAAGSPLRVVADRAIWYLAQAAILDGDLPRASDHLQALADDSPGYAQQAVEQLQELERLRPAGDRHRE